MITQNYHLNFARFLLVFLLPLMPVRLMGQDRTLYEMTIEELMNVEVVTGALTSLTASKIPVSLTTITSDDIALTPARNIADLIEIYVPGALWLNHTSPRIGIRGVIIDRNYKFLLLVNGQNLNQKGAQGATLELSNWDLNGIERIEVIRGPGSVTYGPGAIAGIINIITKDANTSKGISVGVEDNFTYNSRGGYVSGGLKKKNFNLYANGSVRFTDGFKNAEYYAIDPNNGASGYIDPSQGAGVMPLLGDNLGRPQLKFHLDMNFLKEWRFWARYTNSDQPALFNQKMVIAYGNKVPLRFTGQEGIIGCLQNLHIFNENFSLKSNLCFKAQDFYDYYVLHDSLPYNVYGFNSAHMPGNVVYDFLESGHLINSTINIKSADKNYKAAFGIEFSYDKFAPGWGNDKMYMLSNDYQAPDGRYIEDIIADGFNTNTASVFSECNFGFHSLARLLVSARLDKSNYSTYFFSPRVGLLSKVNKKNTVKLIWQRSTRMNTAEELYKEYIFESKSKPEILNCFEVMVSSLLTENFLINVSTSYNWGEMLGFVYYNPAAIKGATRPIGKLKFYTIEAEAKYKLEKFTIGLNHSFGKLISWNNAEGVTSQGISYADHNINGLLSMGNDLNNWADNSTKLFANITLPYHFIFHIDGQLFWKWEGYNDAKLMYNNKYGKSNPAWNSLNNQLDDEHFADADARLNISFTKHFPKIKTKASVYGINLLGCKRYSYSSGEKFNYPAKLMWVNEPAAVGIKVDVSL